MKKIVKPLIDAEGEVRELTAADMKRFRPAREVCPEVVAAYEAGTLRISPRMVGQRGKQKAPTKQLVSIRLSTPVLQHFRATGEGWQTRLDDALRLLIGTKE